jgi:hypothetical protein
MKAARARLAELTQQAATAPAPTTPIAAARLSKLHREIELLEHKVRAADLQRRALENELLFASEAREMLTAALGPLVDRLRTAPKMLSPRIVHQPQRAVEATLTDFANDILADARRAVAAFQPSENKEL